MNKSEQPDDVFRFLQYRILTHYPAAKKILAGVMPAPRTAIVYPTYLCNQNCVWCEYAEENNRLHSMMSETQFRGLMHELIALGVEGVEFCGGGEPTLHPQFAEITRESYAAGIQIGLLTNGTKCNGEIAEALVDCASYVRVGFDGATAETMNRVKRPKHPDLSFDAVCDNVRQMIALRHTRKTKVRISMKVVLDASNCDEVEACVQLAIALGVDSIQFKAARLCATELTPEQAAETQERIRLVRDTYPQMSVIGGVEKITMHTQCWLTPIQIMIDALGDVFLCCYYLHRRTAHCIGNVFNTSLESIWYSERHWEAIRKIQPRECNMLDCRFVHYNDTLTRLIKEDKGQFEFI